MKIKDEIKENKMKDKNIGLIDKNKDRIRIIKHSKDS